MTGVKELWIDFGVSKNRKMIPVHEICANIPHAIAINLPFFHAFTGCDTVSAFCGIGKRTAWKAWMSFREVDAAFGTLATSDVIHQNTMKLIERYVVLMYDHTSTCAGVNECRRILYTRKNRAIENIPPTANALLQHSKRASLQAHIWKDCLSATAEIRVPTDWGWKVAADDAFVPLWSSIPNVSSHCRELVRCACRTACRNCKCRRNELPCTKLCACDGHCFGQTPGFGDSNDYLEDFVEDIAGVCDIHGVDVEEDTEVDNVVNILFDDADLLCTSTLEQ